MSDHNSKSPDHPLLLIQQVKTNYIEPSVSCKRGRPRTYSGLSFLLLSVVAVTLPTFKGLELQRSLEKDSILRNNLEFEKVPHRKTIETLLSSLQSEAEAQLALLGQQIVKQIEPSSDIGKSSAIDGRIYAARGPLWHQKQRKKGVLPHFPRNVDVESKWSKSGYRSWVQCYQLVLQTLLLPVPIPLYATWQPNGFVRRTHCACCT